MEKVIRYDNGLKVVVEHIPTIRSVVTGLWVGAGSSRENNENNGISHFTEHMMFKGTQSMTPFDIANAFESVGAIVNAFTGKENTCYYVKSVDDDSERCFEILCDIVLNSTFDPTELDKERKVIVEEINMVEDSPEEICYDLLSKAMYGQSSLGQPILGSIQNVLQFNGDNIRQYMRNYYTASNTVIAFAGNITLQQADKLVRKYFYPYVLSNKGACLQEYPKLQVKSEYCERIKDFEQSNIAISFPSLKFNDTQISTQAILNLILGGGMSSRLFQRIREQLGLAYSVYSTPSCYANVGSFSIYLNITHTNAEKAVKAVQEEINKLLMDGVTAAEFERAKAQLKAALVFSQESTQTIMSSIGKMMLMADEVYDVNKKIAEIDLVTVDKINDFSKNLFSSKEVCASYVGKKTDVDIMHILKS